MSQKADFTDLIARARAGETAAIATLARLYEPEVRIYARVHLGPALRPYLDSMDLVQSVHRSLLVGLRHQKFALTGPEHLVALALTMVRRKIARKWRRHQRQDRHLTTSLPQLLSTLSCAEPPAVAQLQDSLEKLCARLSDKDQQIIQLRLQGLTTAESASALGMTADVFRVTLSRLRRRLRDAGVLEELL